MGQTMTVTIQQNPNVADADTPTHRYLMVRYWYYSTGGVNDSTNQFSTSGDFPNVTNASPSINIPYGGGSQLLRETYLTVAKTYGASKSIYAAGWIKGIEAWGVNNQAYGNATYVVPARAYTLPSAPGQPSVSGISPTSANVTWSEPSNWGGNNTGDYQVEYSTTSNFSSKSTSTVYNTRTKALSGLTPNTTYYVRVRAFNAAGNGTYSSVRSFTTSVATPSRPDQPTMALIGASSATAAWTDPTSWGGEDTGSFRLQIANNSDFTGPTEYETDDPSYVFFGLDANQTYYIRVQAFNSAGASSWSQTRSFTTDIAPPGPVPSAQINSITSSSASFSWGNPQYWGGDNDGTYRVEVYSNSSYSGAPTSVAQIGSRSRTVTSLTPGVRYWWRVRAFNSGGSGPWRNGPSFETPGVPSVPRFLSTVDSGPIGATLDWTEPAEWGGSESHQYVVSYREQGTTSWTSANTSASSYTIPSTLKPNASYEWTVRAVNSYGWGPNATSVTFVTSAPPVFVKHAGTWKPTAEVHVKSSGAWRSVVRTWVKVSGTWR